MPRTCFNYRVVGTVTIASVLPFHSASVMREGGARSSQIVELPFLFAGQRRSPAFLVAFWKPIEAGKPRNVYVGLSKYGL